VLRSSLTLNPSFSFFQKGSTVKRGIIYRPLRAKPHGPESCDGEKRASSINQPSAQLGLSGTQDIRAGDSKPGASITQRMADH
jgi:hypothetical protein